MKTIGFSPCFILLPRKAAGEDRKSFLGTPGVLLSHPDNPHLAYERQSNLMRDAFGEEEYGS